MSLRIRFGLYWKKAYPTLADLGDLSVFLACLCAGLFLAWNDARLDKEIAEKEGNHMAAQFADFLQGGVITDKAMTFAAKCENLIEVVQ